MARMDDLLAPGYLDGLTSMPIEELRAHRTECQSVEGTLSYLRRLVQGRLDIVLSELHRRREGGDASELSEIVDHLPEILSERVRAGSGGGRPVTAVEPVEVDAEVMAQLDEVADANRLSTLPDLTDAEIDRLADELAALERQLSTQRHALHELIDALQEELVRRYKTGEASVDSLLK
jgi:hypothetical protein